MSIMDYSLPGYQGDHLIRYPPNHAGHVQDKHLQSGKIQGNFQAFVVFDFFIKQEGFIEIIPVLKKNLQNESVLNYHKTKGDQDGKVEKDRKCSWTQ